MASSSAAAWTAEDFVQTLEESGKTLLDPYDSADELLNRLDNLDNLLRLVNQDPSPAIEEALKPSKNALISDELLRNNNLEVKVSVVCCICEIARITVPVEPYGDDIMRVIFQLLIMIFGKLSSMDGRSYSKAASILNNFAKCQLCLLMWDCDDAFIVEMFQLFLCTIHLTVRANHPASVISDMERIMTIIINDDEEDIPVDLFSILLDSLRRENENVSPLSYSMAERVFSNCAVKLKRRLSTADTEELNPDDDGGKGIGPSDSLVNNDTASTRNGDSLCNGISSETMKCLEMKQHKVSDEESNPCKNSDAMQALQGLESEAVSTPKTKDESLKDESSSRPLNVCDQIKQQNIFDEKNCSQTEDPDAAKTVQEKSKTEAVSELKINENTSTMLNACDQLKQNISDATHCSQTEDPSTAKTVQEELNVVLALKVNERTWNDENALTSLQCCDQSKLQENPDAKANAVPVNPGAATIVQQQFDPGTISAPKRRGRKLNSLIKPDEGYDIPSIVGQRKSPYVPRRRRNYRKEIVTPPKSCVSKTSSLPSEHTQSESLPNKKCPRKGNRRNRDNKLNEDGHLLLLSDSARDVTRTSSDEKASLYGAVTKLKLEHTKCHADTAVANMSDGYNRNPERGEGSSVKMVVRKQKRDRASTEYMEKSPSKAPASHSTPNTLAQEFKEAIKAKCKRKQIPVKEGVSELAEAVKDSGERFVGCKIQVYWPLDNVFYKGSVTSFDRLAKKHKVTYDDGDQEDLDLTQEQWELVKDDISLDNLQRPMSIMDAAGLQNKSNNRAVKSSRTPMKKHKDNYGVSKEHMLTSNGKRLKIVSSTTKLEMEQAKDPVTPALNMKLLHPKPEGKTLSKSLQLTKRKKLPKKPIKSSPQFSVQVGNGSSRTVDVHGYVIKARSAPILKAIVAKYGDIAANCLYKSPSVRASLLEVVCGVVRRLKNSDVTASDINTMLSEISDAADAKLEVSWLHHYLLEIVQEEQAVKRSSEVRQKTCLIMQAARKDFEQRQAELVAAQKQLEKAERCVEVLEHVTKKIDDDIWETLAKEKFWQKRLDDLL